MHGRNTVKPDNTDTERGIERVRINGCPYILSGLNFYSENVRVFFRQGQSKLSVIKRCSY